MNNVSFTGHREIDAETLREPLYATLEGLISSGSDMFFTGGASGFDTLAALTVLDVSVDKPCACAALLTRGANAFVLPRASGNIFRDTPLGGQGRVCLRPLH